MSNAIDLKNSPEKIFPLMKRILFLKNVEMFKSINTEKLMLIAKIAEEVSFKKGETISKQNDIGDTLYIIKTGSLRIIQENENQRVVLSIIKSGESYGAFGLFGNQQRSATAEANEDSDLLMIKRAEFKEILYDNPEITYNLLSIYGELLKKANKDITMLNKLLNEKIK